MVKTLSVLVCGEFRIVYCDETDGDSSSVNVHQPTTFAHKKLQMEGITIFWDEFSDLSRGGCKSSPTPTVCVDLDLLYIKNEYHAICL